MKNSHQVGISVNFGTLDVWVTPFPAIIYDPITKELELGFFIIKYCITIKLWKRSNSNPASGRKALQKKTEPRPKS